MGPIAAVAADVLAPAVSSIVGPLVSEIGGALTGGLGQIGNAVSGGLGEVAGGLGNLVSGFEQSFLGGFQGQQATPGQGQFMPFPQPFPMPPYCNNPYQGFCNQGSSGPADPSFVAGVGNQVDSMMSDAMNKLQNANGNQAMIALAQQEMQNATNLGSMLSKLLEQLSQLSSTSISNIH